MRGPGKMRRPNRGHGSDCRPKVTQLLPAVRAEVAAGTLSRRKAAKRLGVGTDTLNRLLVAAPSPSLDFARYPPKVWCVAGLVGR